VSECDRKASLLSRPWSTRGCRATEKKCSPSLVVMTVLKISTKISDIEEYTLHRKHLGSSTVISVQLCHMLVSYAAFQYGHFS
jgi:hypothetical protein